MEPELPPLTTHNFSEVVVSESEQKSGCVLIFIKFILVIYLLSLVYRLSVGIERTNELLLELNSNTKESIYLQRSYNEIIVGIVNTDK